MNERVTQRDVARAAAVSKATVSLALRGSALLPPATRARIARIAKDLGYVPNPMLAGLAAYRMSQRPPIYHANIAWINFWPKSSAIGSSPRPFADCYAGAQERGRELGFNIEEINMEAIDYKEKRLQKILVAKGITGLILSPHPHRSGELFLNFSRFSAVRLGYSFRHPVLHTVVNAQYYTALDAFRNVANRGYRRIGVLLDEDENERTSWNFLGGILTGQHLYPHLDPIRPFYPRRDFPPDADPWIGPEMIALLGQWIRQNRIDAVLGIGYDRAVKAASRAVGYADFAASYPHLSGMDQKGPLIGRAAVDVLVAMLHRGETGIPETPREISIRSTWREGRSLPQLI